MNMELLYYFLGFLFNLAVVVAITKFIYYPKNHDKSNVFTFIAFNTVVFFVISILTNVDLSIGVGFGLFALFSILRYRTDPMPVRDMTYLFIILSLPVLNSIMASEGLYEKLLLVNALVMAIIYVLEKGYGFRYESKKEIKYEKIDLIKPGNHDKLMLDLKERTGIQNIIRFEIGSIDFINDSAKITIYFDDPDNRHKKAK